MLAKNNYNDQFMELDLMPVEELTKDQIFYLMETHEEDAMALNESSVPSPYQCQKIAKLKTLLTKKELKQYNDYWDQRLNKMVDAIIERNERN